MESRGGYSEYGACRDLKKNGARKRGFQKFFRTSRSFPPFSFLPSKGKSRVSETTPLPPSRTSPLPSVLIAHGLSTYQIFYGSLVKSMNSARFLRRATAPFSRRQMSTLFENKNTIQEKRAKYYSRPEVGKCIIVGE